MAPPEAEAAGTEPLRQRLLAYCRHRMPDAQGLRVEQLQRIFGGGSRETWRFRLSERRDDHTTQHDLILRRDPDASLIDTQRRVEVAAIRLFEQGPVPVPRIWWLEEDPRHLGHPFFVMQAITGCEAGPMKLMMPPFSAHHARIAEQKWRLLGQIARADPAPVLAALAEGQGNAPPPPTVDTAWQHELDHWAGVIADKAPEPQPIAEAALRWLRAHPPPPAQRLSLVHGDYRTGNLLVAPDGGLRAVLDWELAHAGDPLEDLAWGFNAVWRFGAPGLMGGLATREHAIATWQRASGLTADASALHWWELFSCVKGQGIWLGAAHAFANAGQHDLLLVYAAWAMGNSQDRAMLDLMGQLR